MNWKVKACLDGMKSVLPFQVKFRALKRKLFGYKPDPVEYEMVLVHALKLLKNVGEVRDKVCLEIGSGWEPIIPIIFRAAGARAVYLTDLYSLICPESLQVALSFLESKRRFIRDRVGLSLPEFVHTASPKGAAAMLADLGLIYLAPCNCQSLTVLPDHSIDVIYSHNVLEHIPETVLRGIFAEAYRLLRQMGLMAHIIDNSDHWQHADPRISRLNFLQHSDLVWRLTCLNPQNFQNRLRHSDYIRLFTSAGFQIAKCEVNVNENALRDLAKLNLSRDFRKYQPSDLASLSSYIVGRPFRDI
jgi:hypothetical protein